MFNKNNIIVFLVSFVFIISLEIYFKPYTLDGIHYQEWTSNDMLQTLHITQLKKYPILSLWYLHIQPPLYDTVRMIIALFVDSNDSSVLVKSVDKTLYFIFALIYSLISTIIFLWVSRLTNNFYGVLATFIWILHPSPVLYATLLETTLLSSFGFTWLLYELWRLKKNSEISFFRLSISLLFIYFTKSIFQWYFIPILILSLLLMRYSFKKIFFSSIGISIIIIFLFVTKQYILFNTTLTTTLNEGTHLCGMIWHNPTKDEINQAEKNLEINYPEGAKKITTWYYKDFIFGNNEKSYKINSVYIYVCKKYLFNHPLSSLINIKNNFIGSFREFIKPSSTYTANVIVDNLPWRNSYDYIFGNTFLLILVTISFFTWFTNNIIRKKNIRNIMYDIGVFLPILYFILISNIGGVHIQYYPIPWRETDRLKFIIEPVIYIFIFVQLYLLLSELYKSTNTLRKPGSTNN